MKYTVTYKQKKGNTNYSAGLRYAEVGAGSEEEAKKIFKKNHKYYLIKNIYVKEK